MVSSGAEGRSGWPEQYEVRGRHVEQARAAERGWATPVGHLDLILCAKADLLDGFKQGGDTICSTHLSGHCGGWIMGGREEVKGQLRGCGCDLSVEDDVF